MSNILIDILGLLKRKRIVKNPNNKDYIPLSTLTDFKRPSVKPDPKYQAGVISMSDLKTYINQGTSGGEDFATTLSIGNVTGGNDVFVTQGDSVDFNSIFRIISTATGAELQGFLFGSWQKIGDFDNNKLSLNNLTIENALFEGQINPTNLTANRSYQLPDSDGTFALDFIQSGQTTDGVQLTLPSSKVVANNTVQSFVIRVSAIQSGTAGAGTVGDVWVHEFRGAIKQIAGVTTIVDTVTDELIAEDISTAGFSVLVEAGTGTIDVKVTGELNKTIEWKAVGLFNEVVI